MMNSNNDSQQPIAEFSIARERTREEFLDVIRNDVQQMVDNVVVFDVQNIHETRDVPTCGAVYQAESGKASVRCNRPKDQHLPGEHTFINDGIVTQQARLVAQTVTFWYDEDAYQRAKLLGVRDR